MYRTNSENLEIKEALDFIDEHKAKLDRYQTLEDYYVGKHDIREVGGAAKDRNNKIVNPYPKYITDFHTGFFMGNSVRYTATSEVDTHDDEFLAEYQEICVYNNEAKENLSLAKTNSIKGDSYEILWIDDQKRVRFKSLQPDNVFLIHGTSIDDKERFGVRYYSRTVGDRLINYIEIYDDLACWYYDDSVDEGEYDLRKVSEHPFKAVPIIHYVNNDEHQGDFEQVKSLIDAYNREESNTLNDMDEFSDAYLVLTGYGATTKEDIMKFKKDRILLNKHDGRAEWLTKEVNDGWIENVKNRLNKDIHKFSFTPDFTDESFGTNLPGISLRLKLLTTEELRATKELYFREGLVKRMDLIATYLNVTSEHDIVRNEITISFSDALPQNVLELTQIINNLAADVSTETRLALLPMIEDPAAEMAKKQKEDMEAVANFDIYANLGGHDDERQEVLAEEERGQTN